VINEWHYLESAKHYITREKSVTFIGGFAPLTPTRGSAPGPRWGPTAAPDPCLFFRRPCHPPPPEIPGSAPDTDEQ
jgi:hypothetical protein